MPLRLAKKSSNIARKKLGIDRQINETIDNVLSIIRLRFTAAKIPNGIATAHVKTMLAKDKIKVLNNRPESIFETGTL